MENGMHVTMIGTGYLGFISGACFADFGHHVTCIDRDAGRIAALKRAEFPSSSPVLELKQREQLVDGVCSQ